MNEELLLTEEERQGVFNRYYSARAVDITKVDYETYLLNTQLAKARPIIEKQERERIIALIDLWQDMQDMGTSLSAGRLISVINGQDEEYRKWMEKTPEQRIFSVEGLAQP